MPSSFTVSRFRNWYTYRTRSPKSVPENPTRQAFSMKGIPGTMYMAYASAQ